MGMINPVVIADAGPIIHLDELGCLELLADFGKVLVPETVWLEVEQHRPLALKSEYDWLVRQSPRQHSTVVSALTPLYSLHAGEQEALHLCIECGDCLLLTDDTAARLAAKSLNITAHGTLGVLIRAIRRQRLTKAEVLALLNAIPKQTSLHVRPTLLHEVISNVEASSE
ncbi:DNA-binding protein [Methylomonas sp. UP202]|uniref:DNA-binding protein n=1 Tax=Methylomonas sp. UP202 TaxID=3040943 RepID=UPI002478893D|nr:DNA-binding protein [Methylomonas sp. UP202]WGS88593.1 DNA-binding protein [Methylomonas sp. UP202]